jgi:lipopolysaccharide transport system permease protein
VEVNDSLSATVLPMDRRVTVIEPLRGFGALRLADLWTYRDLFTTLAQRDVKLRYRQTAIGIAWVLLQPLLASLIFTIIFGLLGKGRFSSDGVPYFLFAFAGQIAWNAFASTVTRSNTSLIQNANLVSKIYFPRMILPLSTVLSTLIDFGLSLIVLVLLMLCYRAPLTPAILAMPLFLVILVVLSIGVGLLTAALTVAYRDIQYVVPVLLQLFLYASPVPYAIPSDAPPAVRVFYDFNPLTGLIEGMRWSLLGTRSPSPIAVTYGAAFAGFALLVGLLTFRRRERSFADVI